MLGGPGARESHRLAIALVPGTVQLSEVAAMATAERYELLARAAGLTPQELDAHHERMIRHSIEGTMASEQDRLTAERVAGATWLLQIMIARRAA